MAILAVALWAAFAVDLGTATFAEHVDTISETPEAKQLIDDTRATINPALMEVRDRVLGEYVEAPTWIPEQPPMSAASEPDSKSGSTKSGTDASAVGRMVREAKQRRKPIASKHDAEPPLPGRLRDRSRDGQAPPLPGQHTAQHTASVRGEHAPPLPGQARPRSSGSEPPLPGQP
ncbi:MAG: hypothetical protein R6X02_31420 [Enhygromyxa sp.]